jgi:polyphenol oxidase
VYFWNKKETVVGIVHAGWRGVQKMIVSLMIDILRDKYGCLVEDIKIEIGPHILDCHFEVQDDVVKNFIDYSDCFSVNQGHKYLSLKKIIMRQLASVGVDIKNVKETDECTYCETNKYFSYRRDKPQDIEAMLAYIGIVE